ncbi:hypothetical protein AVEN_152704-1 [Araneus ventricosus]|uniref:Uncharacterized protein n=1 Tax=Araneus ventricosus TaxID=182803 RepID=A0A4Y2SD54_ARAVE|nr:hypothetical protein AVEN_152704-1 [Araneus ventricosus]
MTRSTHLELAPHSKLPRHTERRMPSILDISATGAIHDGSSVESVSEPGAPPGPKAEILPNRPQKACSPNVSELRWRVVVEKVRHSSSHSFLPI